MKAPLRRHLETETRPKESFSSYSRFDLIDGDHDFKKAVPEGYVEYAVRTRRDGKVLYFNFKLAKEMGLIPKNHPHQMNPQLSEKILKTFSIQIINEYDINNKVPIPKKDIRPNKYMATRYLQLQHPGKRGTTSGDGRSIWNGQIEYDGTTWDVSSCGTGATRLSPATAIEKKYFRTGDPSVCYGCGYADIEEGLAAAIMSETFHRNGIMTERSLAVIEFPDKVAINVRAGTNLIRPSHFFHHLKQGNHQRLKAAVDYYIRRQISNGAWKDPGSEKKRFKMLTLETAKKFAQVAAKWESDYIFVWLDWDGDNMLADGGIIDYGSVRQFGLYHHEYRYDDVDRWSTTIPEQKKMARYILQTFVQMEDFILTRRKKRISQFKNAKVLKIFDAEFEKRMLKNTLYKIGFNKDQRHFLLENHPKLVENFRKIHSHFEKAKSTRGSYKTGDGVTQDAIYCMRDILRELPIHLLKHRSPPTPQEFMKVICSSYANRADKKLTSAKIKKIEEFLAAYLALFEKLQNRKRTASAQILLETTMRSAVINQYDRITGDSICVITDQIIKARKKLSFDEVQQIIENFVEYQKLRPSAQVQFNTINSIERKAARKVNDKILTLAAELRECI